MAYPNVTGDLLLFLSIKPHSKDLGVWLYALARLGLGAVFLYAGLAKLLDVGAFARVISQHDLAPAWALSPLALGLPLLELAAGLGLALELRGGLGLTTALLVLFVAVLWFGILRGLEADCGCFSPEEMGEHDSLRQAMIRDLVMLAAAGYMHLWRRGRRPSPTERGWFRPWGRPQMKEKVR